MISGYGKIYPIGHRDIQQLFDGPVVVQEKIDGSQFSAMVDRDGRLLCHSKSAELDLENPQKLFAPAIAHLLKVKHNMAVGAVYRCEALNRPKHNVLAYERLPAGNLVLFDIQGAGHVSSFELVHVAHTILECEPVQQIFHGEISAADLPDFLKAKPQLGGAMVEGVVVKNYALGLKGKYVAPRFQEIMHGRPARVHKEGIAEQLGRKYCSEARWEKAVAHLRDEDKLTNSVADIGPLIKEIQRDIFAECEEEILTALLTYHVKDLRNGWIQGFPDWYKRRVP